MTAHATTCSSASTALFGVSATARRWRAGASLLLLVALPPLAVVIGGLAIPCIAERLLGLPCPGCGLGRAMQALAACEVGEALIYYPPLLLLGSAYLLILASTVRLLAGRRVGWHRGPWGSALALGVTGMVLGNWLAGLLVRLLA